MLRPFADARDLTDRCPLLMRLDQAADELPHRSLLTVEGKELTRRDLLRRSRVLADCLRQRGAAAGQNLCVVAGTCIENLVTLWASLRLGMRWTPVNPAFTEHELRYVLDDVRPRIVIAESDVHQRHHWLRDAYGEQAISICDRDIDGLGSAACGDSLSQSPGDTECHQWLPGDPAFILYSGGTTGFPKGIVVPYAYPVCAVAKYDSVLNIGPKDVCYSVLPMYHGWLPLVVIMACLYADATCVAPRRFSASGFLDDVRKSGATISDPFGPMMAMLLDRTPAATSDRDNPLTRCLAPMGGVDEVALSRRREFERRYDVETFEMYGLSETGPLVAAERPGAKRWGSSGRPGDWYEIAIVDPNDYPLPTGMTGEIVVRPRQPHQMAWGYLNKEHNTLTSWRNLWVHTGDLGYLDTQGYLFFTGRMAHQIRRRGELISVAEVEAALAAHPAVREAAVVGVPSSVGEEDVHAFVVTSSSTGPEELVEWCRGRLANFKIPRFISFVQGLPRSATKQEIERFRLKEIGTAEAWDLQAGR